MGTGRIEATASIPIPCTASDPCPRVPARPMTGTPCSEARRATSAGTLPRGVWKSMAPSAVMTRSAPRIERSRSMPASPESSSASKRGTSSAPMAAIPAPRPPEAPVPGPRAKSWSRVRSSPSRRRISAQFSNPLDICSTCCAVAPFCGPKTRATPRSPVSTLCGFRARTTRTRPELSDGCSPERSRLRASASAEPPLPTGSPSASSTRAPSAVSAPSPPSEVPESPQPTTMVCAPSSRAARISSPTPWVVVSVGSRRSCGTRRSPAAEAISTTAVPRASPPRRAQCASTG